MTKLSFDYDASLDCETATYKELRILARRADCVKIVIRNRVPLALRADIIAAASVYGSAL